jgi:acyl-CoA reductase-like NAD-dependent aldehyde dehydrogenase
VIASTPSYIDTTSSASPAPIEVANPITGEIVARVPNSTPDEVRAAVARARAAQPAWEARGVLGRARLLRLWGEALWREREALIRTIRAESGKNHTGGLLEIIVLDNTIDYYAARAPKLLKPQRRRTLFPLVQYARVYYQPYGVAGFITPWNYPYLNALQDAVPALVAGNTVIVKPSEIAPLTSQHAVKIAHQVGIPADVIQVVTGDGGAGAALADTVDFISVTGSTATGRSVARRAGERLIPCSLELGGKDPLIVLDDANIDAAALGILQGALENCGQVCVSVERVYVVDAIYDRLVERLAHHAARLTVGPGDGLDVHIGSMTNTREVARCEVQIADAVRQGARVILGGHRRTDLGPLFFEPTILVDVNHGMAVMTEETFGPLIPVVRVADADEAVRLANDSQYGLSSSIFTGNLARGESLARQLLAGDTCVNRTQFVMVTPSLPTGGRKASGLGRRGGPEGLLRFVSPQSVLIDRQWIKNDALTLLDPRLYPAYLALRVLRRWLPFLRP